MFQHLHLITLKYGITHRHLFVNSTKTKQKRLFRFPDGGVFQQQKTPAAPLHMANAASSFRHRDRQKKKKNACCTVIANKCRSSFRHRRLLVALPRPLPRPPLTRPPTARSVLLAPRPVSAAALGLARPLAAAAPALSAARSPASLLVVFLWQGTQSVR